MLIKEFLQEEDGLVTTDWVFMSAMGVSFATTMADFYRDGVVGLTRDVAVSIQYENITARYDTFGLTNREAIDVIEWENRTADEQRDFYDINFERSDEELDEAYRLWASRAENEDYNDQAGARDNLSVLEFVYEDRERALPVDEEEDVDA